MWPATAAESPHLAKGSLSCTDPHQQDGPKLHVHYKKSAADQLQPRCNEDKGWIHILRVIAQPAAAA